ncbi:unnamed protein product [Brachionus calyciflorus]|uniref:BHLH domain-containing protein n=1 Tax=Brachionus calyciflorus TaxID=104777 RepID=A0A813M3T4_9BILA|nr:unnamed protein product [Brachionus calyciflorus]
MNSYDFKVIDQIINNNDQIEIPQKHKRQHEQNYTSNKRQCLADIDTNCRQLNTRIEKRNARERNRVKLVNCEFEKLRKIILDSDYCRDFLSSSCETCSNDETNDSIVSIGSKRISKLKILRTAIDYINHLSGILKNSEVQKDQNDLSNLSHNDLFNLDPDLDLADFDLSCLQIPTSFIDSLIFN